MKNIVFVIESLHLGGAEKSLVTLLNNLDYKTYRIDLILFKETGVFKDFVPKEVNCIQLEFPKLSLLSRLKYGLDRKLKNRRHNAQLFWGGIQNEFKRVDKEYDIAIAYNQGFATYFVNQYINAHIKYSWLNIDYQKAGYDINFDYLIYKNYDAIIAVSPEAKAGLVAELKKINKVLRVEIIKDISDKTIIKKQSEELKVISFNSKKINILTVGRLAKQKGLHLAVESCKILIDKGYPIHWYVVGEGSERKYIENLVSKNKVENYFTLVGVSDNPYPYMNDCDIYVQTSLFEGLGLTVIEASILNKPIVSTNFPTAYGILKHNETGLIAAMNAESIALHIERLILDEGLRQKLSYNLSLKEHKDKEATLAKIYNLFEK